MIEPRQLVRIEHKKEKLDRLRPLPAAAVARLRDQIIVEWIYNSKAIEGSTITLQETRLILETGLTVGGKSLCEHFEVINHRDAIDYVEDLVAGVLKLGKLLEFFKVSGGLIIDCGGFLPTFKQAIDLLPCLRFAFGQSLHLRDVVLTGFFSSTQPISFFELARAPHQLSQAAFASA